MVSSTNKTDRLDIVEILLKVALSTIKLNQPESIPLLVDYRYEDLVELYLQTSDQKGHFLF
jgi:hypothetical protein